MKREKFNELIAWKKSTSRKPLIIRGARQVGKTWLMKEFGNTQYTQTVYINFEKNKRLHSLFIDDFDIKRVIIALQAETGLTIDSNTLIVFDEIQAVPEAIPALRYFYEEMKQSSCRSSGHSTSGMRSTHLSMRACFRKSYTAIVVGFHYKQTLRIKPTS